MIDFTDWASEVEAVSTLPEFQNAQIVIYTATVGEYDMDTGDFEVDYDLIYQGQARVVGVRTSSRDNQNFDPTSIKPVRVQVVRSGISGRVPTDAKAYFISGGRNPQLEEYVFNVVSDFNSSHVAAYTFEFSVDLNATDSDRPVFS